MTSEIGDLVLSADARKDEFSAILIGGKHVPHCIVGELYADGTVKAHCHLLRDGGAYLNEKTGEVAMCTVIGKGEIIRAPINPKERSAWFSQFEFWPDSIFEVEEGSVVHL